MGVPLSLHVLSGDAGERVVYGDSTGATVLLLCGSRELPARDLISTDNHKVRHSWLLLRPAAAGAVFCAAGMCLLVGDWRVAGSSVGCCSLAKRHGHMLNALVKPFTSAHSHSADGTACPAHPLVCHPLLPPRHAGLHLPAQGAQRLGDAGAPACATAQVCRSISCTVVVFWVSALLHRCSVVSACQHNV